VILTNCGPLLQVERHVKNGLNLFLAPVEQGGEIPMLHASGLHRSSISRHRMLAADLELAGDWQAHQITSTTIGRHQVNVARRRLVVPDPGVPAAP